MKAIAYRHYGAPDVLRIHQRSVPRPTNRQVLIRVAAAGINPIDYRIRRGEIRWLLPGGFPRVPGFDVAGWVEQAQPSSGLSIGDRVIAYLDSPYGGGYAQYAACGIDAVAPLADSIDFVSAAGLPLAGSTVLQALRNHSELRQGDGLLINGASGGVGALAVQIAKAYGAEVTGVASAQHLDFVRGLGADEVIDYRTTDFTQLDRQWEIVFDVAGTSSYAAARHVLSRHGRFVSTEPSVAGAAMSIVTSVLKIKGRVMLARPRSSDLRELVRLASSGQLSVPVDRVYPLEQAAEAHRHLESGGVRGKLILQVSTEAEAGDAG